MSDNEYEDNDVKELPILKNIEFDKILDLNVPEVKENVIQEKLTYLIPDWAQRIIDLEGRLKTALDRIATLETLTNKLSTSNTPTASTENSIKLISYKMGRSGTGTTAETVNHIHITPGLLLQWGRSPTSSIINLAKSYKSKGAYLVVGNYLTKNSGGNISEDIPLYTRNETAISFQLYGANYTTATWFAVGYAEP